MEISSHVNGWGTIARQLQRLNKRQGELSRLLNITPAAISQLKKEIFLLNPIQLEKIAVYLQFDEELRNEFYTELFNARLLDRGSSQGKMSGNYQVSFNRKNSRNECGSEIPLAELSLLADYEPSLESLHTYLLRNTSNRSVSSTGGGCGICALLIDNGQPGIGLSAGSIISIESERYPESNELNLLALRDGSFLLREFIWVKDQIILRDSLRNSADDIVLKKQEFSESVRYLHPVSEITMRMQN
ncbi:MAG: hypothetical protein LBM70_10580 [Victivallales bacterium]|jgi:hypothetical protein|nr:hypothetical protein [Victivallales bacterium]